MNGLVRACCSKQTDYIFTSNDKYSKDADYIVVPDYAIEGTCSVSLQFPGFQSPKALPVVNIVTMLKYFNVLLDECLGQKEGSALNGGRVLVPGEDNKREFEEEFLGIYLAPSPLHEVLEKVEMEIENGSVEVSTF